MHLSSLIRFALLVCFCCSPLLLSVLLSPRLTLVRRYNCLVGAVLLPFVCLVLLCVCCPVGVVSSCCLWLRGIAVLFGSCAPRFAGAGLGDPVLPALPCCASCLCPSCLPCPARGLFCALVQLTLLCAGASLGVSGCSCDGSVALLSCWECGLA